MRCEVHQNMPSWPGLNGEFYLLQYSAAHPRGRRDNIDLYLLVVLALSPPQSQIPKVVTKWYAGIPKHLVYKWYVFKFTCLQTGPEGYGINLVCLWNGVCSCGTRRHVFSWHKKICVLVTQEDMCWNSCDTRTYVFVWSEKTCLLTCLRVAQVGTLSKNHTFYHLRLAHFGTHAKLNTSLLYHVFPDPP